MNNIKSKLNNLTSDDMYSLMLFSLYVLKDQPQYKVLSELIYLLDKDSLLKLIKYFGGQKIELPTIKDLRMAANCLLLVQYVSNNGMDLDDAIKQLNISGECNIENLKNMYYTLQDTLSKYTFSRSQ